MQSLCKFNVLVHHIHVRVWRFSRRWWRQCEPPKRRYPTKTLRGVTTQKTWTWNISAVKASKLAN